MQRKNNVFKHIYMFIFFIKPIYIFGVVAHKIFSFKIFIYGINGITNNVIPSGTAVTSRLSD